MLQKFLLTLRDYRIKASHEEIVKSLEGFWSEEHLFELEQCYRLYDFHNKMIMESVLKIEKILQQIIKSKNNGIMPNCNILSNLKMIFFSYIRDFVKKSIPHFFPNNIYFTEYYTYYGNIIKISYKIKLISKTKCAYTPILMINTILMHHNNKKIYIFAPRKLFYHDFFKK